jgi:hypothetical protein
MGMVLALEALRSTLRRLSTPGLAEPVRSGSQVTPVASPQPHYSTPSAPAANAGPSRVTVRCDDGVVVVGPVT